MATYVEVDYGVPHTKYQMTDNGFVVEFKRPPIGLLKLPHALGNIQQSSNPLGMLLLLPIILGFYLIALCVYIFWSISLVWRADTRIEVTPDAVIIDEKKMRRVDFGAFQVATTWKFPDREDHVAVLGYSLGPRSFEFGGAWTQQEATEVAGALNQHLNQSPKAGDEHQPSPEVLRTARPTDF